MGDFLVALVEVGYFGGFGVDGVDEGGGVALVVFDEVF